MKAFGCFLLVLSFLISGCTTSSSQDSYTEPADPVEAENEVTYVLESFNEGYPEDFTNRVEEGLVGYTAIITIENLSEEDLDYSILDFRLSEKEDERGISPESFGTNDEFPLDGFLPAGKNYTGNLYFQYEKIRPLYLKVYDNRKEATEGEDPLVTWILNN